MTGLKPDVAGNGSNRLAQAIARGCRSAVPLLLVFVALFIVPSRPGNTLADIEEAIVLTEAMERASLASREGHERRALVESLAKRYRVAESALDRIVGAAYASAARHRVDPLLVLAVAAIESGFNPFAESAFGALGLMQVIPRFHMEKVGADGVVALLDPAVNIDVGTRILAEYLGRAGKVDAALQIYGGASEDPTSSYSGRVLAERARLEQVSQRGLRAI
jgi:soluble lytic murein transglycosylase-like protein